MCGRREDIAGRLSRVRETIELTLARVGRPVHDVTLVGVTKTVPASLIVAAAEAGLRDFGESRVQEALPKMDALPDFRWHMVGHLQMNKVRKAVGRFSLIQSVDSARLSGAISEATASSGVAQDVLIEVNSSGEETKFGLKPDEVEDLLADVSGMGGLVVRGLMTIGPLTDDRSAITRAFDRTFALYEKLRERAGSHFDVLSMGMSADYTLALECGSNMVRVGTAIFGPRG